MGRKERVAEAVRKGEVIRRLHWQCWREDAPPVDVSLADLVEVLPVLLSSGSVGVVWPRVMHREAELGAVGAAMRAGYEAQVAHNAEVAREIGAVVSRLREVGVEPVLIKGLAVARLYPSPLIRTAGDIDLVVRDEAYAAAKAALADLRISFHRDREAEREQRASDAGSATFREASAVDLHAFSAWGEAASADFFEEATSVTIGDVAVSVPRVEDHLRALCLHFLRHAGVRPMRLCDIGLLLETGGYETFPSGAVSGFDWERVLAGTAREAERVAVALRLAEELLGAVAAADLDGEPDRVRDQAVPGWLREAVLRQWGAPPERLGPVLPEILATGGVRGIGRAFARRWPDAITATLRTGAGFGAGPRWPVQVAAYAGQMGYYARVTFPHQLATQVRERREGVSLTATATTAATITTTTSS